MLTALKIAARESLLALRQANFVRERLLELYPGIDIALLKRGRKATLLDLAWVRTP